MRPSAALTKTSPSAVTSQGVASAPTRQRQVSNGSPRPGSVTGASRSWKVSFTALGPTLSHRSLPAIAVMPRDREREEHVLDLGTAPDVVRHHRPLPVRGALVGHEADVRDV